MDNVDKPSICTSTSFLLQLSEALDDGQIAQKFQSIMSPLLKPVTDALQRCNATIESLQGQLKAKDAHIADLQKKVDDLELQVDGLEQQGRRGSMRIFGIPEDTPGAVDDKVLTLCNDHIKVSPKLILDDLEVVHRLGKPPPADGQSNDADPDSKPPPRSIIVKFASRRTKARVMENKKNLKDNPWENLDGTLAKVYVTDDLTKRRATLAFKARQLKRAGKILDTWTTENKILVKDSHNRIHPIKRDSDLRPFEQ